MCAIRGSEDRLLAGVQHFRGRTGNGDVLGRAQCVTVLYHHTALKGKVSCMQTSHQSHIDYINLQSHVLAVVEAVELLSKSRYESALLSEPAG